MVCVCVCVPGLAEVNCYPIGMVERKPERELPKLKKISLPRSWWKTKDVSRTSIAAAKIFVLRESFMEHFIIIIIIYW